MIRTRRNFLILGLAVLLVALLVAGCGTNQEGDKEGSNSQAGSQAETLTIAMVQPYTGGYASVVKVLDNATRLAVDEINAAGGFEVDGKKYNLKVTTYDTKQSPEQAVTLTQRAIEEGAGVIFGDSFSGSTLAMLPLTKEAKKLQVTPSGHPDITKSDNPYVLRVVNVLNGPARSLAYANYLVNGQHLKNIVVVYSNSDYGLGERDAYVAAIEKVGGKVVSTEVHKEDETDFYPMISKIKGLKDVDAILWTQTGYAGRFLKQAVEQKITPAGHPRIVGEVAMLDADFFETAGGPANAEGFIGIDAPLPSDLGTAEGKRIAEAYKAKYGQDLLLDLAAAHYDMVYMITEAMKQAGTVSDADAIRAKIPSKDNPWPGKAIAAAYFEDNGQIVAPPVVWQIKNGQREIIQQLEPYEE